MISKLNYHFRHFVQANFEISQSSGIGPSLPPTGMRETSFTQRNDTLVSIDEQGMWRHVPLILMLFEHNMCSRS